MDLFYTSPIFNATSLAMLWQYFTVGASTDYSFLVWVPTAGQTWDDFEAAAAAAQAAYATAQGYSITNNEPWYEHVLTAVGAALPMYVNGVAKIGTFPVVASPSVAGGSGVVRFYIDSNGDGTGTAPSEVYAGSLQAVVVNSTTVYQISSVSVDTNRKYIDITMRALTFATGLAGLISVVTGASLANAANGTVVNCFVVVKK